MFDYRLRFSKENSLKYLSHLELLRAIERGLRRVGLPLAYSTGFHPHPKIAFGPALSVGISSSDEYFDLQLVKHLEAEDIKASLNAALPEGLRILAVRAAQSAQKLQPLNAIINRASYVILLQGTAADLTACLNFLQDLLASSEVLIRRVVKKKEKIVNIRPWLHNLTVRNTSQNDLSIELVCEIGNNGSLKPNDLLKLIPVDHEVTSIQRNGLWYQIDDQKIRPLEFCLRG